MAKIIKTYKANTNVSINVVLASKKNLHITFTPLSNGTSTFTTDNEAIQNAIESHARFGSLFRLIAAHGESEAAAPAETSAADAEGEVSAEKGSGLTKVTVTDTASAKDYLADKFGISRTSMRSTKAIIEQAAAHGIEFEGI